MDNQDLLTILENDYNQAFNYRERRHSEWNENYNFYRGKVTINRLTQRQNFCAPLMKETIKTWLAYVDDPPDIAFEQKIQAKTIDEIAEKEDKEIELNAYWEEFYNHQKIDIKDIVDKKQVGLNGRSFKKLNVIDGRPTMEIIDPQDILIDRFTDPTDIDTARFLFHIHIYRPLKSLENNKNYDREAIEELKKYYATQEGLVKLSENYRSAQDKAEKLEKLGVPDVTSPTLGETYVELNECYRKFWNEEKKRLEIYLIVKAEDKILMNKPLEEVIGKTFDDYWTCHFPFSSWADDVEKTDFWSDSLADIVRPINKVLNIWFSQLIENRTLRNFGMNYYDATDSRFIPQTFEPLPWGWYPIPGDPNKLIKRVDIPELTESLDEIMFLINLAEKASAVTAIQKGVSEKKQITLGEVEILAGKARERAVATAKFYRESWEDFANRWYKFIEAQADNLISIKASKKSWKKGKVYTKIIKPKNLISEAGYQIKVSSSAEQESETFRNIQKFMAVKNQFPDNRPLNEIYQKRLLEMLELNPDEIKEVLEFEKQKIRGILPEIPARVPETLEIPTPETKEKVSV